MTVRDAVELLQSLGEDLLAVETVAARLAVWRSLLRRPINKTRGPWPLGPLAWNLRGLADNTAMHYAW